MLTRILESAANLARWYAADAPPAPAPVELLVGIVLGGWLGHTDDGDLLSGSVGIEERNLVIIPVVEVGRCLYKGEVAQKCVDTLMEPHVWLSEMNRIMEEACRQSRTICRCREVRES